jgi:hypothetical protein
VNETHPVASISETEIPLAGVVRWANLLAVLSGQGRHSRARLCNLRCLGAASAPRAAENNLAVLVLKVLIEPQAGTGLGYDGGERYTNNNSGLRRVRTKVFEIRE